MLNDREEQDKQSYFGYSLKLENVQQWITIYYIFKVSTQQWWKALVTSL